MKHLVRIVSFVLLSVLGTSALMYCAPGYLTEEREMDATHAVSARSELASRRSEEGSLKALLGAQLTRWSHGDLGRSRQYDVPVKELLPSRARQSGRLLLAGIVLGWSGSFFFAAFAALGNTRKLDLLAVGMSSALLAIPVGAFAVLCLLRNTGTPVVVLAFVVGARDLKLQHRLFQAALRAPYVLQAQAQGVRAGSLFLVHIWPNLRQQILALQITSLTLALSALVPIEVVFDLPGLGNLAWSAAMNRDLPTLLEITTLMAGCVAVAGAVAQPDIRLESSPCV